jgi:hypothetical protein
MAVHATPLLRPIIVVSDIFMLKKDTPKTHYNNIGLNILDNAPLTIYQANQTLANHGPQDRQITCQHVADQDGGSHWEHYIFRNR